MKKLNASFTIEDGKELILRMKCKDTKEFAENWLIIYNTARENKKSFLNCKLFFNSDIVVLTTVNDEKNVKEWLSRFGDVYIKDVKYRLLDFDGDYEYDTEYDIIDN
jgi:hypothetical protein